MKKILVAILLFVSVSQLNAQSIVGHWSTVDDNTGEIRSVVEIFEKDNKYYGKVVKLADGEDKNAVCNKCDKDDDRYEQPIIGLEILRDLSKEKGEYTGGNILDPESGTVYKCKLWIENGQLMVRGYVLFVYRTQTWKPYKGTI